MQTRTDSQHIHESIDLMIPRIIHQTWNKAEMPRDLRDFQRSWLVHHPAWEYRLWNDNDNLRLIQQHYPEFIEYFTTLTPNILKVDFVRIAYMHHQGGIYADLDIEVLKPFDPLLEGSNIVCGWEFNGIGQRMRGRDFICNALIASPPGHPVWMEIMHLMASRYRAKKRLEPHSEYVIGMAMRLFSEKLEERSRSVGDITIHSHELFFPAAPTERLIENRRRLAVKLGSYAIHHYEASWISPWSKLIYALMRFIQQRRTRR
jgi:hypothetical protein